MIEVGLAGARWLQIAAAGILCGVPAFALYGLTPAAHAAQWPWTRRVLISAVMLGLIGAGVLVLAQSAEMSGDPSAAFDPGTVWVVISGTRFGAVWTARFVLLLIMSIIILTVRPAMLGVYALAVGGVLVAGSLAWLGHGGDGGPGLGGVHLLGDVMHLLAASVWIGALVALARLLGHGEASEMLYGLRQFSGVGSIVVATLVLTGIWNAWALTSPQSLSEAIRTPYAFVLFVKVGLFVAMLALAALNRFVLTPRLSVEMAGEAEMKVAITALRRSIAVEMTLAALVIVAVAALGVMEPPSAG
ncbi:MAG: copper homeostasis membrane protein CopD [Betaproteobacteria bacterium]